MSEKIKSSKLRTDGLDFEQIKTNLKEHFKSYPEFSDYDFEGSALSTIIDILAYNTHYLGMYAHVSANESFIDSASKRASLVSIAKSLGYTPRSLIAPKAILNVQVSASVGSPATITMPKKTVFSVSIAGEVFSFITMEDYYATKENNAFLFENVEVFQGKILNYKFVVGDEVGPGNFYKIPNKNIDTRKILITVQENAQSTNHETFYPSENFADLNGDSNAFFIQETFDGFYELEFGDGIIGKKLQPGNIILVEYLVTPKINNGLSGFTTSWSTYGASSVTTVQKSFGGKAIESNESVRFTAPKFYESQNRAVTANDYRVLITKNFENINSVAVWGGEENDPPVYGKVFISIDSITGDLLTESAKQHIKENIVRKFNMVSVIPEIVNPQIIFLNLTARVAYDSTKTSKNTNEIQSAVSEKIKEFFSLNIEKHDASLYHSVLTRFIDESDESIISSDITFLMNVSGEFVLNAVRNYQYNLANAIEPGTVQSSNFLVFNNLENVEVSLYDNGEGTIFLKTVSNGTLLTNPVGSVDYVNGVIELKDIRVNGFSKAPKIYAAPEFKDIYVKRNLILKLSKDSYDPANGIKSSLFVIAKNVKEK